MGQAKAEPCVHRWVLGEPQMSGVTGVCRRCGARRRYPARLEFAEAVPQDEELTASRLALVTATAPLGERV